MSIRAVAPESALLLLVKVLALLGLEVVIRNVEHLILHFERELIIFLAELVISMREVARLALGAVSSLLEVFAELGLE